MPHLLYVESSPRKERSASIEVAGAFLDAWRARHPDGSVDTLDVWNTDLPAFDGDALDGKYAALAGEPSSPAQDEAWRTIRVLADRFRAADLILFGVPMWNYGIPYRLKHLFDLVSQKDLLFTFDERGQNGLLDARAVVVNARGVAIGADFPAAIYDHQATYMATWLRMVGITDVHQILVERGLMGADLDAAARAEGRAQAASLAATM
ncbi:MULTISPECIES: NAD(P)H-dependent oxidoreductase [unclassified Methylobacterium]|uniref:FMN-dependent NADH-azoreductase n=1 Tax=unclassified Methylobacterium TaxID=2615210 RepID=UPI0006F53ACE|nr:MULTISPECIES: NAD(P)H-dependent oxidoreductase [unclassified Methylobacterium]KQP61509.1 FMN-dependent NADH-azoreductase [Methylobacterium sp. Leaf108]KQT80712.1 FMN-dependent NADH-azoreductase [Methylobacterium sp. Leaf466]